MYITCGMSKNGKLSNFEVFDLKTFKWSTVKIKMDPNFTEEAFPETWAHKMILWGESLLMIGGFTKKRDDILSARAISLDSYCCHNVQTDGEVPVARDGHSANLIGNSQLVIFGGADWGQGLLNDVHILDLTTMRWTNVETREPPSPRFDHAAAVQGNRHLLIFGGCSHRDWYNDLHVLDSETLEWSRIIIQEGPNVGPRAGHDGVLVKDLWYISGGCVGNTWCEQTIVLDISNSAAREVTSVVNGHPLATAGLSLLSFSVENDNFLVAFGGYNMSFNNKVFAMRLRPPSGFEKLNKCLLGEILYRLPPNDQVACRLVCKTWKKAVKPNFLDYRKFCSLQNYANKIISKMSDGQTIQDLMESEWDKHKRHPNYPLFHHWYCTTFTERVGDESKQWTKEILADLFAAWSGPIQPLTRRFVHPARLLNK